MKHIFLTLVFSLFCAICIAQTSFSSNILNGDIKMKEHFYEMALSYYKTARSVAANSDEASTADRKIADCERVIKEIKAQEEKSKAKSKSKLLFSDQYLESGDVYSGDISSYDENKIVGSDDDPLMSLYVIDVYNDHIRILSHSDDSSVELGSIPAGTVIQLTKETSEYRRYSSKESGEDFIFYKKVLKNTVGRYHIALRKDGDKFLRLYSSVEVRQVMMALDDEDYNRDSEQSVSEDVTNESRSGETVNNMHSSDEILPISFIENWALNLDANGNRLDDSRSEPLVASKVRWLALRLRYRCPEDYDTPIRFDIRIETPSGKLLKINGKGVSKGFSTYEVLETIPGGGIFTVAFGSDEPGSFSKGKYIVGIWYKDVQYYSVVVELQ